MPPFQQRFLEKRAVPAVHAEGKRISPGSHGPEDENLSPAVREDIRIRPLLGDRRLRPGPQRLRRIRGVPVSAHDHRPVPEKRGRCVGTFPLQDGQGRKTVHPRVILFHAPALADAEIFGIATTQERFCRAGGQQEGRIMGIQHFHPVPFAPGVILRRSLPDKTGGVTAEDRPFPVQFTEAMGGPGRKHGRHLPGRHGHECNPAAFPDGIGRPPPAGKGQNQNPDDALQMLHKANIRK